MSHSRSIVVAICRNKHSSPGWLSFLAISWPSLPCDSFQVYVAKVDPTSSLGLSTDSIYSYSMGHIKRVLGGEAPETQPSRCMSRGPTSITVALKGTDTINQY